jgi:hypothetical protein
MWKWLQYRGITWRTKLSNKRLDDACALNLVVVLTDNPRLTSNIGVRKKSAKCVK